jgi:fructose-1-phosphate kinase PfkB-like protein
VALCGTFPPGVPDTFYEEAVRAARHRGIPVLLDGYRGVLPTLQAGVELLKVNAAELCALMERDDLAGAAADCLAAFPVRWLAVTAGGGQAHLFRAGEKWDFTLPKLERVLNPIGAGDTAAAVLLAQVAGRRALLEEPAGMVGAFRQALAAASASCLTPEPARFDPAAAATLATRIVVQKGR